MNKHLRNSLGRGHGATATETIMMIILVALIIMAGIKLFEGGLTSKVEFANDTVGAVSTENQEMNRLRERGRKAEEAEKNGGGTQSETAAAATPQANGRGKKGVAGAPGDAQKRASISDSGAKVDAEAPAGGCGGFNPFLIPIALGMLGLLGYVIIKSQKS